MLDIFWVRTVAGCNIPVTLDDIEDLRRQDVSALLSLTEHPMPPAFLHGFATLHVPIRDFSAPRIAQLRECVGFIDDCLDRSVTPAVHCAMGRGRTGTVLAAWLIAHGTPADDAMAEVRHARPGAIETDAQESILYEFEHDLRAAQQCDEGGGD